LTWDRGSEMAQHRRFSLATDIQVYFCDPQQPWQRGSNENTNGLLRQYFPKGMDLSNISQNKLNAIARRLNERPRQTRGHACHFGFAQIDGETPGVPAPARPCRPRPRLAAWPARQSRIS
jgi:hypothetical protein